MKGPHPDTMSSSIRTTGTKHLASTRQYLLLLAIGCALAQRPASAQTANKQLWLEYMLEYPMANVFNLENAVTYSTLLGTPQWRALDYAPNLEYSLTTHIDLMLGCTFSYTWQTEDYNTLEIRPMVGTRIHFTPNRRVPIRFLARLEQRNFLNLETKEWDKTLRPRFRLESLIPLNAKDIFQNKMYYIIADVEWLWKLQDDVNERFANRFRARVGLGYRLNYTWRFEIIYMLQFSREAISDDYSSTDNIFRVRLKHYINKAKPSKVVGVGN